MRLTRNEYWVAFGVSYDFATIEPALLECLKGHQLLHQGNEVFKRLFEQDGFVEAYEVENFGRALRIVHDLGGWELCLNQFRVFLSHEDSFSVSEEHDEIFCVGGFEPSEEELKDLILFHQILGIEEPLQKPTWMIINRI